MSVSQKTKRKKKENKVKEGYKKGERKKEGTLKTQEEEWKAKQN